MTDLDSVALRDRARGALLGLAVGDALGTTLEFTAKDSYPPLTNMVGGGPFGLKPGEWTDDTSMALALGESLLACDAFDESDLMARFCAWAEEGQYSHNGRCFDIGITVRGALNRFRRSGNPVAGSTDPQSAGNGTLMRLAPVPIRFAFAPDHLVDIARRQSRTTHAAEEAVEACAVYAGLIAEAIQGKGKEEVLMPRTGKWPEKVARAMRMETIAWDRAHVRGSGYVIHSLEAALWAVGNADSTHKPCCWPPTWARMPIPRQRLPASSQEPLGCLWHPGVARQTGRRQRITDLADRLHDQSLSDRSL